MKKILIIIIITFISKCLYAQNLFETKFTEVEFISNNIENDKIKKIDEVKIESILDIFSKTLENNEYHKITNLLSKDLINTFINNIIINDEKIIENKYFSKIKINFNKKKIVNYFQLNNIPYVEYYPDKFLLIILEEGIINDNLFTLNNKYYNFLNQNLNFVPVFKTPNLDINDRFILNKKDIKNVNLKKLDNFANKYNLYELVIVTARTNNDKVEYSITLISNNEILKKNFTYDDYELNKFYEILEYESINLWKIMNQIKSDENNIINCNINYFNMLELKEIRNNIDNLSIIKKLKIKSISYKNLEYEIHYYGNLKIFKKIFELNKMKINDSNNSCSIKLK